MVESGGGASESRASVIIPTYNEREIILNTIDRVTQVLESANAEYEVLVIDDDSPDKTWRLVERRYGAIPRVKVERRQGHSCLGTAICHGFRAAEGEIYLVMDADGQHPPEAVPSMLRPFDDGAEMVIGSRYVDGAAVQNWPKARWIISKGAELIARRTLEDVDDVSDPLSGFFAVRASAVEDLELEPRGFKVLLEILAKTDTIRVAERPITFRCRERGTSKLSMDVCVTFLQQILRLRTQG